MASYMTDSNMAGTTISRHVGELEPLTTEQFMTNQAHLQQYGMFIKLSVARTKA